MKKPNCPCWGCESHMPTCKRECAAFAGYEKAYKEYEKQRQSDFAKREATEYWPRKKERYYRDRLMDQKRGKKRG